MRDLLIEVSQTMGLLDHRFDFEPQPHVPFPWQCQEPSPQNIMPLEMGASIAQGPSHLQGGIVDLRKPFVNRPSILVEAFKLSRY